MATRRRFRTPSWIAELVKKFAKGPKVNQGAETEDRLGDIPIVSYRTPADLIILPSTSSRWERAENLSIPCPLHPLMTFSPRVRNDILARLAVPVP